MNAGSCKKLSSSVKPRSVHQPSGHEGPGTPGPLPRTLQAGGKLKHPSVLASQVALAVSSLRK